jgi:hypothetical protein
MPQFPFLRLRETVRASAEIRREGADAARRAWTEMAEIKAGAQKAIIESRELMAQADAIIPRR